MGGLGSLRGLRDATSDTATRRSLVSGLLFIVFVVLLVWECWMLADNVPGDTVSAVVRRANLATGGLLALVIAALWFHWFSAWPASWHSGGTVDD
jgi:hypothetical protein